MQIRAVAFDVDGTLYPNSSMYLNSLAFAVSRVRFMRAYAKVRSDIRKVRPIEDFASLEAAMLADRLGVSSERARQRIEREIYGKWERTLDRVRVFPGVRECVGRIKGMGLPVAVSSDFPVAAKIRRLGFGGVFDCELWTQESGYLKPHPEPFAALASCLGVEPAEILYVGNSYRYDIVGARSYGMQTAHIARRPHPDSVADLTFSDYRVLCEYVVSHA